MKNQKLQKDKNKTKSIYSVSISILSLVLIVFLLFGPLSVPVFSRLGDSILKKDDRVEKEQVTNDVLGIDEVIVKEEEEDFTPSEEKVEVNQETSTLSPSIGSEQIPSSPGNTQPEEQEFPVDDSKSEPPLPILLLLTSVLSGR